MMKQTLLLVHVKKTRTNSHDRPNRGGRKMMMLIIERKGAGDAGNSYEDNGDETTCETATKT